MGRSHEVVVVGAGIVGLALAWRAAQRGLRVLVLEARTPGIGASRVAAGMLAPRLEVEGVRPEQVAFGVEAAERWPGFARELEAASGLPVGYRRSGAVSVALGGDDVRVLRRELGHHERLGLATEWRSGSALRELEPLLSPRVAGGLLVADDHQADPRRTVAALLAALAGLGVEVRDHARVEALAVERGRVCGVVCHGDLVAADRVVLAAGAWSGQIDGVPPVALRPVKGQVLRLRGPEPLLSHVVWAPGVYLVPRADGELVVGATVEERGFDERLTAGAALDLLRAAFDVLPGVVELELLEQSAGLRPATPDNAPLLGDGGPDGLVWATGHGRNGILLAPLTADLIAGLLVSGTTPALLAPFAAERAFEGAAACA